MIVSLRPAFPLSSVVDCIWHYEGIPAVQGRERVLPDGRFQIVLNLNAGNGAVCGLRSQHVVIDPARIPWMMGVVFRPGGAPGFLGASAFEFWNRSVALDLIWGSQAARNMIDQLRNAGSPHKRGRILEAALTDRMQRCRRAIHPVVDYALQIFDSSPDFSTVADVSRDVGWSRRWFSHAFSEQVGMTPKRYCRLIRFRTVVRQIASNQPVDWVDVALSSGFCDQAHLVHEFHAFCGLSPERYLRAEHPFPNHFRTE